MTAGFILRRWDVSVDGFGSQTYLAPTRGKALSAAWRAFASSYDVTFGEFLRKARATVCRHTFPRFGDPITVGGQPGFFCGEDGQYVHFARPGGEFTLLSHPNDVEPEQYRPRAYRPTEIRAAEERRAALVRDALRSIASDSTDPHVITAAELLAFHADNETLAKLGRLLK